MLKNIFIIDDDEAIGSILESLLNEEGYSTQTFLSGKEALKSLQNKKPDLILLDYSIPSENVKDTINGLRNQLDPNIPIIMMSAHEQAGSVAKKFHLHNFLAKPFQRSTLIHTINEIFTVNHKNL